MINVSRSHVALDHVALDVADRARSAAFYQGLFGAEIVADDPAHGLTFLRMPGSERFADLALHEHPSVDAAYPPTHARGAHTAWAVADVDTLVRGHDFFAEHTSVKLVADFGIARSVMGTDLDGHVVELLLPAAGDPQRRFEVLDIDTLRRAATAGATSRRQSGPLTSSAS